MLWILLCLFIGVPLLEVWIFVQVGQHIGALTTVLLSIFTAVVGLWLVKQQGLATLFLAQSKIAQDETPGAEMFTAICLIFAGFLLFFPGFLTDFLGILLLFPAVRHFLMIMGAETVLAMASGGLMTVDMVRRTRDEVTPKTPHKSTKDAIDVPFEDIEK
jgi:UPF0716 protein FxsA